MQSRMLQQSTNLPSEKDQPWRKLMRYDSYGSNKLETEFFRDFYQRVYSVYEFLSNKQSWLIKIIEMLKLD